MISTQKINFVAFHIDINQVVLKQAQDVAKAVNNENYEESGKFKKRGTLYLQT